MAIIVSFVTPGVHGQTHQLTGHVRSTDAFIASLLDNGAVRSETVRRLIARVDSSDVIVYVQPMLQERQWGGYLSHWVVSVGGVRYVHVRLRMAGRRDLMIAVLAHELQHVVEIADRPDIVDAASATRLLAPINNGRCLGTCYETTAAQDVQRAVAAELRQARETASAD